MAPELAVDQPGHRPHSGTMVVAMFAIHLAQRFIPSYPSNRVLDHNPSARKRAIEGDVLWWPLFATRLAPRCHAQTLPMQFVNADVGQVASRAHALPQARHHARLFERLDVRLRSWHAISDVT